MSADGQRTKRWRKSSENFNRLSRVHERYRQTTDDRRQTDGRTTTYSEHELEFTFAKKQTPEILTYPFLAWNASIGPLIARWHSSLAIRSSAVPDGFGIPAADPDGFGISAPWRSGLFGGRRGLCGDLMKSVGTYESLTGLNDSRVSSAVRLRLTTYHRIPMCVPSVLWHCWLGHLTRTNPSPIWPIMCLVGR